MPDLHTLMSEAVAGIDAEPSEFLVEQDLRHARRVQAGARARRVRRALVPAGLAASVVAALALSLGVNGHGTTGVTPTQTTATVTLTAYDGVQPKGFTIDKVPAGWEIRNLDTLQLLIAPAGKTTSTSYNDKILISRANQPEISAARPDERSLQVGDVEAKVFTFYDGTNAENQPIIGPHAPKGLLVPDGKRYLLIQFAEDLNWNDATMAAFAAGVRLTSAARTSGG
jgi:hypothetical protein